MIPVPDAFEHSLSKNPTVRNLLLVPTVSRGRHGRFSVAGCGDIVLRDLRRMESGAGQERRPLASSMRAIAP